MRATEEVRVEVWVQYYRVDTVYSTVHVLNSYWIHDQERWLKNSEASTSVGWAELSWARETGEARAWVRGWVLETDAMQLMRWGQRTFNMAMAMRCERRATTAPAPPLPAGWASPASAGNPACSPRWALEFENALYYIYSSVQYIYEGHLDVSWLRHFPVFFILFCLFSITRYLLINRKC